MPLQCNFIIFLKKNFVFFKIYIFEALKSTRNNHPCGSTESKTDIIFFNSVINNAKEKGLMIPNIFIYLVPQKTYHTYEPK